MVKISLLVVSLAAVLAPMAVGSPVPRTLEAEAESVPRENPEAESVPSREAEVLPREKPVEEVPIANKPGIELIPIGFGAVVGEIIVDSGVVSVERKTKSKTKSQGGPSFSPLISGPVLNFSAGMPSKETGPGKPPKEVSGATLVFNNEAAIVEIV